MPDGYCRGGEHYIGDADECARCDEYEQQLEKNANTLDSLKNPT